MSLASSFALLLMFGAMWIFPPALIHACLIAMTVSLAIFLASASEPVRRLVVVRWLACLAIAVCMLPCMLPVGFFSGVLVAMTGVWDDPVGSHADLAILGPIGSTMLGALSGPVWSFLGVQAVVRRSRAVAKSLA